MIKKLWYFFFSPKLDDADLAIMHEAFMIGRIYSKLGEKESPIEIYEKLQEKCLIAKKRILKDE